MTMTRTEKMWYGWTDNKRSEYRKCRSDYIGRACTLNGQPAKTTFSMVSGWPSVSELEGGRSVEYSFTAIYNIIDNKGGRFTA